jgi:hypothetical protein
MAGQHWGERDGKPSPVENALIGIFSTIATFGFYGGLLLTAVALLRAETCTVIRVSDGDTIQANCAGITRTIRASSIDAPEPLRHSREMTRVICGAMHIGCRTNPLCGSSVAQTRIGTAVSSTF